MSDQEEAGAPVALPAASNLESGITNAKLRKHLVSQLVGVTWKIENKTEEQQEETLRAAIAALNGLQPQDEAEGMLGVQMIATHHAAIECLQRAIFDPNGRDRGLVHATKLLRIYVEQLTVLDRRRGAGKQQVNVGTVNVEPGAQAIVGNVGAAPRPAT